MHLFIEHLNGMNPEFELTRLEIFQYKKFYYDIIKNKIIPFRTEWRICAPDISLGGTLDFLGQGSDGCYVLFDWKRSKRLYHSNTFKKKSCK